MKVIIREGYKPLPNLENHKCFGCSPSNPSGLQMKFYSKDKSVFSWVSIPDHLCGWHNLAHGGAISAILDEIMGRTALYTLNKLIMTKAMNIEFLKPVLIGQEMKAQGKVLEHKNDREAIIEGFVYDEEGLLYSKATGTFALFTPEYLTKMGIMDKELISDLKVFFSN